MSLPPVPGPSLREPELPDELPDLDEPTDAELFGLWPDPFSGPPDGEDAWLGGLSLPELDALAEQWESDNRTPLADALGAGFARDLPGEAAVGFAAGGPLDGLLPDPVLAAFAAEAFYRGFAKLSDDELVGVLCAVRRLDSWQAAMEFTAVAELDSRRRAQADRPESSRVHDHVNAELAAALVLTGRSADGLLDISRGLARLPVALAALAAGQIDRERAAVFVAELAVLDDRAAEQVALAFTDRAGQMTSGQLRWAMRAMVLALHPEAARLRAERGRRQTRVEAWPEGSGNAGLAGRELPPAEVIAADNRISAIAQSLRDAGAPGGMDELRAAVFTALLVGRDPASLYPDRTSQSTAAMTGSVNLTVPVATWLRQSDAPGEVTGSGPVDADTCRGLAERLGTSLATRWCLTLTDQDGRAVAHGCARESPGPPGDCRLAWLASIKLDWLERDECGHKRRVKSYRPSKRLRHLIDIRHKTCGFPGCCRPAQRCDADHTVPFDKGGATCECNMAPLCRHHHRAKQAAGWHLDQPEPGVLVWTTPHGRTYTVRPDSYPVTAHIRLRWPDSGPQPRFMTTCIEGGGSAMSTTLPAQGWYRDPYGLHENRYISDGVPTKLVRDGERESYDPPPDEPLKGDLVAAEYATADTKNWSDLRRADDASSDPYDPVKARRAALDAFDASAGAT